MLGAIPLRAATPVSAPEYQIKAAYLLLFTRYVEWPARLFAAPGDPLIVGVLGADPFGKALDATLQGKKTHGRPLHVLRVATTADARTCHVLYIGAADAKQRNAWLAALQALPVLTVADGEAALAGGAVLVFITEIVRGAPKVRFDASLPAMEKAGLKISSQMLVSARKVHRVDVAGGQR